MFRRPRQLQLQAEHSREQIIPVKVKEVKIFHALLAKLAVLQEGRWCGSIQGTCWYVGSLRPGEIPALLPCTHLHTHQNSGLHRASGALLPALTSPTQGCSCSHWALGALCKLPIRPHFYWGEHRPISSFFLPLLWWSKYLQLSEWGWQQPQNFVLDSKCHI